MTRYFGDRIKPMFVGLIFITMSAVPLAFLNTGPSRYLVYPLAALLNVGAGVLLNTSMTLISDVIGKDV